MKLLNSCANLIGINFLIIPTIISAPQYSSNISHYTTRQSEQPTTMFLPRFMTTRTQRSIKFIGTKIWNNIPHDVKKLTYSKFKPC